EQLKNEQQQWESLSAEVPVAPRAVKAPPPPPHEKVKVTLGGFLAAETVWRQRNEVADIGSNFGAIPYPFSPLFNENEFHGTARQSRISFLLQRHFHPFPNLTAH